jgi:hypothetical protein
MRPPALGRGLPLSEQAYLELGETTERIELFDGSLYLTARGRPRHQFIVGRLKEALRPAAQAKGFHLLGAVNLRLGEQRIVNPDVIIARRVDFDDRVVDARAVVLVAEVAPASDEVSRLLKQHFYTAAGIGWYLRIEEETGEPRLHRLADDVPAWPALTRITPTDLLPPD